MPKLLDRLAAKLTRKITPTAAALGAENAPTGTGTGAAISEIAKEQAEETEA